MTLTLEVPSPRASALYSTIILRPVSVLLLKLPLLRAEGAGVGDGVGIVVASGIYIVGTGVGTADGSGGGAVGTATASTPSGKGVCSSEAFISAFLLLRAENMTAMASRNTAMNIIALILPPMV